jgi:hypothetical protein
MPPSRMTLHIIVESKMWGGDLGVVGAKLCGSSVCISLELEDLEVHVYVYYWS